MFLYYFVDVRCGGDAYVHVALQNGYFGGLLAKVDPTIETKNHAITAPPQDQRAADLAHDAGAAINEAHNEALADAVDINDVHSPVICTLDALYEATGKTGMTAKIGTKLQGDDTQRERAVWHIAQTIGGAQLCDTPPFSLGDDLLTFVNLCTGTSAPDSAATGGDVQPGAAAMLLSEPRYIPGTSGQPYFPRLVGGHHDVCVLESAAKNGMHVALVGPPGSGKTTAAQVTFGEDLVVHTSHGQTSPEELVARWEPNGSDFVAVEGPLVHAMRTGRPILLDELPRAPHETQALLLSVMDHRRYIDTGISAIGDGGRVHAEPGFVVLVAYNPDSGFGMPEALHDRISFTINVPTLLSTARDAGVPESFVNAALALQRQADNGNEVWVPSLRSLLKARDLVTAGFGITFAAKAIVESSPDPEAYTSTLTYELNQALGDETLADGGRLVAEYDPRALR